MHHRCKDHPSLARHVFFLWALTHSIFSCHSDQLRVSFMLPGRVFDTREAAEGMPVASTYLRQAIKQGGGVRVKEGGPRDDTSQDGAYINRNVKRSIHKKREGRMPQGDGRAAIRDPKINTAAATWRLRGHAQGHTREDK